MRPQNYLPWPEGAFDVPSGYTKTIMCLANSRKPGGRCVAGRSISNNTFGGWIRPVSARPGGELSPSDRRFAEGIEPSLLDIMHVKFLNQSPHAYQPENHTIDDQEYWILDRNAGFQSAVNALDPLRDSLWGTGFDSYSGINDRVPTAEATAFGYQKRFLDLMAERKIEDRFNPSLFYGACLLCSEATPHHCHRRLVCEYLNTKWDGSLRVKHL